MNTFSDDNRLLTMQELADRSDISVKSIQRLRKQYPEFDKCFLKLGRSVRISWNGFLTACAKIAPVRTD